MTDTNKDREMIAGELLEMGQAMVDAAKRVKQGKTPMSEAELGAKLWPQGFPKPTPKKSWR